MSVKKKQAVTEGSKIIVTIDGERRVFTLVSHIQPDSNSDIISIHSPVGSCLLNKQVGDTAACQLPNGTTLRIDILSIS